jgi:serine/threonine protein kinase
MHATTNECSICDELDPTQGSIRIGSVKVESRLHECTMGASFLGRHEGLDLPVLLRFLPRAVRADSVRYQKIVGELRRLVRVRNPHLAAVIDLGEHNGFPYIVTEFVEGVPLSERIAQSRLSEAQAFALLMPVAEALTELWRHDFVYRNVSPHVIQIQSNGNAKLDLTLLSGAHMDVQFKHYLTPRLAPYWSPEEKNGGEVTRAADMWSYGATLYEALTGRQAPAVADSGLLPADSTLELHQNTRGLLQRLLDRNPQNRFADGDEFLGALRSVQATITARVQVPTIAELSPEHSKNQAFDVGDVIGNALLTRRLGAGAFGVVYLARHLALDTDVAVKLLPMESVFRDPNVVEMFLREARTAARIRDKHVIGVYETGVQDGQHYLMMEYAPGGTVAERLLLYGGKLPLDEVLRVIDGTARGLDAAAQLDIIHRDIKPENLMYDRDGAVKVADMGLAKRLLPKGSNKTVRMSLAADQLTMNTDPGSILGTPGYIAPEMAAEPETVDTRADLYSLGVTAYQLLTGRMPFEGKSAIELMMKHVLDTPIEPRAIDTNIPEELNAVVMKLMAKKPAQRYQSAREVLQAINLLQASLAAA